MITLAESYDAVMILIGDYNTETAEAPILEYNRNRCSKSWIQRSNDKNLRDRIAGATLREGTSTTP